MHVLGQQADVLTPVWEQLPGVGGSSSNGGGNQVSTAVGGSSVRYVAGWRPNLAHAVFQDIDLV
jgi:hypothetical protein